MNRVWKFLPLLFFVGLGLLFWRGLYSNLQELPSAQVGKPLASITLPDLNTPSRTISMDRLKGKVRLLNIWASWCSSCAEEQVFLLKLAHNGFPIVGLNYKDDPESAKAWLREWGNPYQRIAMDPEGKAAIELGVYGTPETFLIDKKGVILYRFAGVLNDAVWQKEFIPRIREAEKVL